MEIRADVMDVKDLYIDADADLDDLFKLQKSGRYVDILEKIEHDLVEIVKGKGVVSEVIDDAEYNFIVACNALLVDIDNEIVIIHDFILDKYKLRFPELGLIVNKPVDYARVVKKLGNNIDLNFEATTIEACNRVLALDSARKNVVHFVENRMGCIAPNLSVVVGSVVAMKLMVAAGGLLSLGNMPWYDIELLGADLKNLPRFPPPDIYDVRPLGAGYINQSGVFKSALPNFRIQTYQLLAKKCKLAAHMDSTRGDLTGEYGRSLREEIFQMIVEWQKPVPFPTETEHCKRRRGGRVPPRPRPIKKKKPTYDIMKLVNNMIFGVPEKPKEGHGMLGQVGSSGADTMSSLAFTSELSNSAKQAC